MLSLIYNAFQYALKHTYSNKNEDINEIISRIESAQEKDTNCSLIDNETSKDETSYNEGCYFCEGTITMVANDHVLIDNHYVCEKNNSLTNNLKVGNKISYLTYQQDPSKERKVVKIVNVSENWAEQDVLTENFIIAQRPCKASCSQKSIIAKVAKREGRIAILEPTDIRIDLSKVQSNFIPLIGDWLVLESLIGDEGDVFVHNQVINIDRIKPLRSKLDIGVISEYNEKKEMGVIDKNIVFHKRVCEPGYIPCVGDKVVSDSIESDQGIYNWRSVTLVPLIQASNKPAPLIATNNLFSGLSDIDDLLKNKYGIIIDDELKFNINIEEESTLTVSIQNSGSYTHILQGGSFAPQKSPSQLSLISSINTDINTVIYPSESITYTFKCKAKFVGISKELFTFNFKDFKIGRLFHITVNAKNISRETNPTFVIKKTCEKMDLLDLDNSDATYIPGIKPYKVPAFIKVRNRVFKIPQHIWNTVLNTMQSEKSQMECEIAVGDQIPCLLKPLSFETYKNRFHALLYLEEIAQILNLRQYDMENKVMRNCKHYLVLNVPGLVEKRPSLLVGDKAIISFKWDNSQGKLKYEGFIHKITSSEVFLKFNDNFHYKYDGEVCEVRFKSSNFNIQRYHNAIDLALSRLGSDFLFPNKVVQKEPQFHLEEYEIEESSIHKQVCHKHNESISSNNSGSSNSIASVSDTSFDNMNRSSSKMSVAERLFNVKPVELLSEKTKTSITLIEKNQNFKMNLANNSSNSETNIANPISRKTNESIVQTNDELEPYITQIKKRKLKWFNENLNCYQKEAVKNILKGLARPLPYVIFGPPGTGKTITMCETILQILTVITESRILVATPSNSSANLIAEYLLDSNILKPGDLVRLIAHHCLDDDSIPIRLLPYCATAELATEGTRNQFYQRQDGTRLNCPMSILGRHRITIGTCSALGILHNMGFPSGHFSHVLVDEAGQATEPEIMIPLNFIHSDYGQVVLAGDPMQLGPVVQSKLAANFGFGESFLSRLLHQFPYQRDPDGFETGYDPRLVTKLIMNYRSLPEILDLPNRLFYESELQPQISSKESKEAKLLEMLRAELPERNGSPPAVIFHGVNGENCRDSDSPSWYNPEEATQVYMYLLKLYNYGLEPDDIGIITPYQRQVLQIKILLSGLDVLLPKISSVEGFQGQERNVIILSVVRSCNNIIEEDIKHALGFVASPKRLNVAITRARALLIILGNPKVLALDPYWRSLLIYCIDNGAYTGCNFLFSHITDPQSVIDVPHESCDQ